jgi:hypothetical protein
MKMLLVIMMMMMMMRMRRMRRMRMSRRDRRKTDIYKRTLFSVYFILFEISTQFRWLIGVVAISLSYIYLERIFHLF